MMDDGAAGRYAAWLVSFFEPVTTPEIRQQIWRERTLSQLRYFEWDRQTDETLAAVLAVLPVERA